MLNSFDLFNLCTFLRLWISAAECHSGRAMAGNRFTAAVNLSSTV